jgi:ubiquinone/menaquinone biosynthesis C-methylase UbiE
MIHKIYNLPIIQKVLLHRRISRINFLLSKVNTHPHMSVLDIGCGPDGRSLESYLPPEYKITGIDLYEEKDVNVSHPNFTYFKQDASDLSRFNNKQFDLAISIGMMEHICDEIILNKMAAELDRVARQYIIVVPWRYGWIEPHFKVPFFQLYPQKLQLWITRWMNLNNLSETVITNSTAIRDNYQWLSNSQWMAVYKGSKAYVCPTLETIALVKCE